MSHAQDVIGTVKETPRSSEVRSGVIDSRSGLEIKVSSSALASFADKGASEESSTAIKNLLAMSSAARQGLAAVQAYLDDSASRTLRPLTREELERLVNPISDAVLSFEEWMEAHEDHPLIDELGAAIMQHQLTNDPAQNLLIYPLRAAAFFRVFSEYADKQLAILLANSMNASVSLMHLRDPDASIRREVKFLEGFTESDELAWEALTAMSSSAGNDPTKLLRQLSGNIVGFANTQLAGFKVKIDEEVTKVQARLDAVVEPLNSAVARNRSKYEALRAEYVSLKSRVEGLSASFEALRQKVVSLATEANQDPALVANTVISEVSALIADVSDVVTKADEFFSRAAATITGALQQFENDLKAAIDALDSIWPQLAASYMSLVEDAKRRLVDLQKAVFEMANFAAKMQEIGRMTGPFPNDGIVVYTNRDGILSNEDGALGKPLVSGDELLFQVSVDKRRSDDTTRHEVAASRRFYVYRIGHRTDRLFFLAASPSFASDAWKLAPTWADINMHGTRKSVQANRLQSIGYGIAVSTMDLDSDDQFELGVAGAIAVLDERLVFGHGWNLGLGRNYWFVGWRLRMG